MKFLKFNILINLYLGFLMILILTNCEKSNPTNQNLKYSTEQKNEFTSIISSIIGPEQKQFPPLLTFVEPQKLYLTKNTNLLTDSIGYKYLSENKLFNETNFDIISQQNNFELERFDGILKNINLTNIDSTKGTITKVIYTPIINSKKDNAFVRVKTLDSGHFLDTRDYWLKKENKIWKIIKEEMIALH